MPVYLGLDGFRWGWVAAEIDDQGQQRFYYGPSLERLLSLPYQRAMIDIPIGLPVSGFRACDEQARAKVKSSVFCGARRGIWDFKDMASANKHYWRTEGEGKGISCQLWNLREKIRDADLFITPKKQKKLRETHPELVFWSLNGQRSLDSKKTEAGRKQRIAILKENGFKKVEQWLDLRFGTGIGRDDLIDACACAIAARDATQRLGGDRDVRGLCMEIYY